MPKRKKGKKTHRRTHRRIGGAMTANLEVIATRAGAIVAGAALGFFANAALKKSLPASIPPWIPGAGIVGAGVLLPKFVKSPLALDASFGMIAAGGLILANETFLSIPGISGLPSNAGGVLNRKTVGSGYMRKAVGAGAGPGFMNKTVGSMDRLKTVGALFDN